MSIVTWLRVLHIPSASYRNAESLGSQRGMWTNWFPWQMGTFQPRRSKDLSKVIPTYW